VIERDDAPRIMSIATELHGLPVPHGMHDVILRLARRQVVRMRRGVC
jgi:hypothetical protein